MKIDVYSDRAKQAIQSAQSLALARRHQQLAPEHLLKVLLEEKDGLAGSLIQAAGGKPDAADTAVEAALARAPKVEGGSGQLYMKPETARVFHKAEEDAKAAGDAFVTTERLLAAIAKEGGAAAEALKSAGVTAKKLDDAVAEIRRWPRSRGYRRPQGPHGRQRLSRGRLRCPQALRPRPDQGRPRRQAGPGDRP